MVPDLVQYCQKASEDALARGDLGPGPRVLMLELLTVGHTLMSFFILAGAFPSFSCLPFFFPNPVSFVFVSSPPPPAET